jgi:hypothetical protein
MIFLTELKAIDPEDGKLKNWCGPNIEAISFADAEAKVSEKGYLTVVGQLKQEVPCKEGTFNPDWNNAIDYDNEN